MELGILYAIVAGLLWGSSPVLVKRGLAHADVSAATLCQQGATLLALVLAAVVEGSVWAERVAMAPLVVFVATGIVGAYLGRTLFVKSVDQIGASRAQSLNNSSPLITVLLAALVLGEALSPAVLAGVLLILAGVVFVARTEPAKENAAPRALTLTSLMATVCYGIVPVLKKIGTDWGGSPVAGALIMHATGLALLLAFGRLLKIELKWHRLPAASLVCFVVAGVFQGAGSILTLKALVHAPASVVAPIWSAQPVISFFLTKAMLQGIEVVTLKEGAAAALVVAGVLVLRWA